MGKAFVQRVTSRIDDVGRRIEIGLADLEMDDVAALFFKCARFHQYFECGLSPETRHALGEAEFALCSFIHRDGTKTMRDEIVPSTPDRSAAGDLPFKRSQIRGQFADFRSPSFFANEGISPLIPPAMISRNAFINLGKIGFRSPRGFAHLSRSL